MEYVYYRSTRCRLPSGGVNSYIAEFNILIDGVRLGYKNATAYYIYYPDGHYRRIEVGVLN